MGADDDLAKLLPEAPPRPDRREAAIAEALRRFDGQAPSPRPRPQWARPAWTRIGRTQMGVIMSMAVLGVVAMPIALNVIREHVREPEAQAPMQAPSRAQPLETAAERALPAETTTTAPSVSRRPQAAVTADEPIAQREPEAMAKAQATQPIIPPAPAAAPPAPPPAAAVAADLRETSLNRLPQARVAPAASAERTVAGQRRSDFIANAPVVRAEEMSEAQGIVVTGSRLSSRGEQRASQRGDWNACTVDDPAQRLDACKRQIDPAAKGDKGRAAAKLADGLTLAWNGEPDRAVAAFDAAIAIDPKLAFAYLNRGIVRLRNGDAAQAIADLDQALRHAPQDARSLYYRSLAFRRTGDDKRAQADAERAVSLNRQYEQLFD